MSTFMSPTFEEQQFICEECGTEYVISSEERHFYSDREDRYPIRCLDCRERQRSLRNADLIKNLESRYSSGSWQEHLGHFGGSSQSSRNGPRKRGGHATICSSCGAETVVPFIPRRGKPVYCPKCFAAKNRNRR